MYIEGQPPLSISYASPEQTRQDGYEETLETAGDKGHRIKKVKKVNDSKVSTAWKEVFNVLTKYIAKNTKLHL